MMTEEEIAAVIQTQKIWKPLKSGTFNDVCVSVDTFTINEKKGNWVLKTPKTISGFPDEDYYAPELYLNYSARAIRKWNELNPNHPAYQYGASWVAPYLGNIQATDDQIAIKLIDIYLRTRNIIIDAPGSRNFIYFEGETYCVDVDQALRRGSIVSDNYYTKNATLASHTIYFVECEQEGYLKTVDVIKTLVYLEQYLQPDEIKDEYLNLRMISLLSDFRINDTPLSIATLEILLQIIAQDPNREIENCYINGDLVRKLHDYNAGKKSQLTKDDIIRCLDSRVPERHGYRGTLFKEAPMVPAAQQQDLARLIP